MRYSIRRKNKTAPGIITLALMMMTFLSWTSPCMASDDSEAAATVREAFVNIQSPALEILKKTTRLDMLDYWDADSIFKATNAQDGLSWLENVSPSYLKIHVSPVSTYELKLLPVKKGEILMGIYTVGDENQASDSEVEFYDLSLNKLSKEKYFKEADLSQFFEIPKGSETTMKEIREMVPFPTVVYSASPDSNNLKAYLTIDKYMDVDNYNILKIFLKPETSLIWNGRYK